MSYYHRCCECGIVLNELDTNMAFARGFALTVLASLLFAGIVYPWSNAWVCAPFVAAFLVGAWMLAGRRQ